MITMVKLYSLTTNGRTFFFTGNIPLNIINSIEQICQETIFDKKNLNYQEYLKSFVISVQKKHNIELSLIQIEHVFRKY